MTLNCLPRGNVAHSSFKVNVRCAVNWSLYKLALPYIVHVQWIICPWLLSEKRDLRRLWKLIWHEGWCIYIKKIDWIIHSIYGGKKFHSLRSECHSILTPVEWKFTTQRVESRPVHWICTPKEVITDVTLQGVTVTSVTNRVKFTPFFLEYVFIKRNFATDISQAKILRYIIFVPQ